MSSGPQLISVLTKVLLFLTVKALTGFVLYFLIPDITGTPKNFY